MRLKNKAIALVAAMSVASGTNHALSQVTGMKFNGYSNRGCLILLENNGTLESNAAQTQLSSKLGGAVAGKVRVKHAGNFFLSALPPISWDEAPTDAPATVFTSYFSGVSINNGRDFPEQLGTVPINTKGGNNERETELTIHLEANATAGNFTNGDYTATVTVLCE